jgi:hypothetical protein
MKGGVAMKRNQSYSYITKFLEASSTVEVYRIKQELEEKLRIGFKPDEIRDFVSELLELVHNYKRLKKNSEILKRFAELLADYLPVPEYDNV